MSGPSASKGIATGCSFLTAPREPIFIPEDFARDEQLMIETAEQFSRKEVLPLQDRLDAQEDGLMPGLIRNAGELGFCGIDSPDQFGGLGLGKNLAARILEFLSLNASYSVTVGITSGISQFGLVAFGTESQKSEYLPKLTSGEWIGAYALSEPNSGSDALSMTTTARLEGDHYVLDGTKMWISNAKWADFFLVMAKVDGEHVSAFLVERGFPGVSVAREEHKMGLKGSSTARLVLEGARVPTQNLLHTVGKGHQVAFNALNIGRFKLGAMSIGPAREAIGLASQYAQDRRQFGQPISSFGLMRQKFADMAAQFFAAESALYRTGAMIDEAFSRSNGTEEQNRMAAEEFAIECSAVKVFCTEAESRIVDEALQSYGGYGFTEEFPIARIYRDARVSRIYEGTNEINRFFLSSRFVKRVPEVPSDAEGFIAELAVKALRQYSTDQVVQGAVSDLLMLTYVEQSARLRGERLGGVYQLASERFSDWACIEAARAYRVVTGESISMPAPSKGHVTELSDAILAKSRPL